MSTQHSARTDNTATTTRRTPYHCKMTAVLAAVPPSQPNHLRMGSDLGTCSTRTSKPTVVARVGSRSAMTPTSTVTEPHVAIMATAFPLVKGITHTAVEG